MMHRAAMVEAHNLTKSFGPARALAGLNLTVLAGTTTCLMGPNGAGKTTAIRILATLVRPDAGWARVAGYDVVADGINVRRHRSACPGSSRRSTNASAAGPTC